MTVIISAVDLMGDLARGRPPVLLDIRWDLTGPSGRSEYAAGHLPGAHYVDLETELAGPAGPAGRHPLPPPEVFAAAMRRAGVGDATPVVVYDGGRGWAAARAWWLLRWAGHQDVRVLDGGFADWPGEVTTREPEPAEGTFTVRAGGLPVLDADAAARLARDGVLLDARAGERYRGEREPVDPVAGHIPGARSLPVDDLADARGRLREPAEVAARCAAVGALPGVPVGVYCGSGVSAARLALALATAGVEAALYPGSWSAWTHDGERPVATGPEPG